MSDEPGRVSAGRGRRAAVQRADWILLIVLVAAVGIAYLLDAVSGQELRSGPREVAAILLALVPLAVWMAFFYQRDRIEPEPLARVATVVAVAALAAAVAEPIIDAASIPEGFLGRAAVSVLWAGAIREWVKYAAVRVIAVESGEVGELADGIVYGTAAGLGYATVINLQFVLDASSPIDLGPGFVWMAVVALAHAGFGGVVGYFAAVDELHAPALWWMPAGVAVAALADGLFFAVRSATAGAIVSHEGGATAASWVSVAMAVAVVGVITVILARVMAAEEEEVAA
ncbi:MAG: PrsW family intramembrane metalloprotease [Actinobacteria bacterium]|nr:PrsW family intramembrane metalloprotease [Actinomycetota bacterium]